MNSDYRPANDTEHWLDQFGRDGWHRSTSVSTTISVFTMDGRSETFDGVQIDTVDVRTIGSIGSFKVISFKTLDFRTVNVLDVSYWTVDSK